MRCVWCDSEYTFSGGEHFSIPAILDQVRAFGCKLVEVTGGEPLAQQEAFDLIEQLCSEDYEVLVETGGYVSTELVDPRARIILDVKCPGSGEEARNHWPNIDRLRANHDEVKFVIADRADWDYTLRIIEKYRLNGRIKILISPVWDGVNLKDVADWVAGSGLDLRMQLQIHKYIWGAETRGV